MRKWVYGAIATVASLGQVLTILLVSGVFKSGGQVACSYLGTPPGGGPLPGGATTTVATAQSTARFPVLMPDVPAARLANLTETQVYGRTVALIFDRGKVTITMARANYGNALKMFQRFIRQFHAVAAIDHVRGQPALVISPRTDGCGSNPAWVEFKHHGIDINIYSHNYGTDVLLSVADSLRRRVTSPGQ
jgi:hypothetical protein